MALLGCCVTKLVGIRSYGEYNYRDGRGMGSEAKLSGKAVPIQLSSILAAIGMF